MSSIKQRRSRLQDGYCIEVSRRSAQATVGKRLAQGPYVAARAEVEPTTLRLRIIDLTYAPPRPVRSYCVCQWRMQEFVMGGLPKIFASHFPSDFFDKECLLPQKFLITFL